MSSINCGDIHSRGSLALIEISRGYRLVQAHETLIRDLPHSNDHSYGTRSCITAQTDWAPTYVRILTDTHDRTSGAVSVFLSLRQGLE